jgi:hypothetical protein
MLDRDAGRERVRGGLERRHRTVAEHLHDPAPVALDARPDEGLELLPAGRERTIAHPDEHLGRADAVAEQDGGQLGVGGHADTVVRSD